MTLPEMQPHKDGVVISIKAQPGSRKAEFRGTIAGELRVCVTAVAEKGKANQAIVSFLRKRWKLKNSQVEIVSGEFSQHKRVLIRDLDVDAVTQILRRELDHPE